MTSVPGYNVLPDKYFENFADYLAHQVRREHGQATGALPQGPISDTIFEKIPFDLESERNNKEKQEFKNSPTITHIVCLGGHSVVRDTGRTAQIRVPKVKAACTTFFFNRLGECAILEDGRTLQQLFKELRFSIELENKGKGKSKLDAATFLSCIENNEPYIGVQSPVTINTKDTQVHDLYTFCGGDLFGNDPDIIPSCFIVLKVGSNGIVQENDQVDTLFEKNEKVKIEQTADGFKIKGLTHFKKHTRDPVTLGDIYSTISDIPGLDLNTTALVFFGCRTIHGLGIISRLRSGGKHKTKANKKSFRGKRKNGSRRSGRSRIRTRRIRRKY
jgi:hypothetical protein